MIAKLMQRIKEMDRDILHNAVLWTAGAILSSILPLLVMVGNYVAYNCKASLFDFYTGYTDTLAFLFAVTISLLLLCFDTDKRIDKNVRNGGAIISLVFMIISIIIYANRTKQRSIDDSELREMIRTLSETKEVPNNVDFQYILAMWDEPPIIVHIVTYAIIVLIISMGWIILTKHIHAESDDNEKGEKVLNESSERK